MSEDDETDEYNHDIEEFNHEIDNFNKSPIRTNFWRVYNKSMAIGLLLALITFLLRLCFGYYD